MRNVINGIGCRAAGNKKSLSAHSSVKTAGVNQQPIQGQTALAVIPLHFSATGTGGQHRIHQQAGEARAVQGVDPGDGQATG